MGTKYFECKPGKGRFAFLKSLKPDKRKEKIPGNLKYTRSIFDIALYKATSYCVYKYLSQLYVRRCYKQFIYIYLINDKISYNSLHPCNYYYVTIYVAI